MASVGPVPARIAASSSLVVVLPLLPPTPSTSASLRARQAAASAVSAAWVSRDGDLGQGAVGGSRDHGARGPARRAAATNALPSKRSPASATNSMPASIVRESVETPANAASAPARRPPAIAATSASRPFMPHPARVRAGARGR